MSTMFDWEKARFIDEPRTAGLETERPLLSRTTAEPGVEVAELVTKLAATELPKVSDRLGHATVRNQLLLETLGRAAKQLGMVVQQLDPKMHSIRLLDQAQQLVTEVRLTKIHEPKRPSHARWRMQVQSSTVTRSGLFSRTQVPIYFSSVDEAGKIRRLTEPRILRNIPDSSGNWTRATWPFLRLLSTLGIFVVEIIQALQPVIIGVMLYRQGIRPIQIQTALKVASWHILRTDLRFVQDTNLIINEHTGELFLVVLYPSNDHEYDPGDILFLRALFHRADGSWQDLDSGDRYTRSGRDGRSWVLTQK